MGSPSRLVLSALLLLGAASTASAEEAPSGQPIGGPPQGSREVQLRYALNVPPGEDPNQVRPAVLALAPGPQNEQMVDLSHSFYWDAIAQRGWIVVSPVAPDGRLFFDGAESLVPPLLEDLRGRFRIEGNAFHIAGISNGGIAAFRIAENDPELFCSLTAFPGLPGNDNDFERLDRLKEIPVSMVVGENDARWVERMRETETRLKELEVPVSLEVIPGAGHVITQEYPVDTLHAHLEAQREGCRASAAARAPKPTESSASD